MKVAWVGTFDPSFSRNRRLREYLNEAGIQVDEIRQNLWPEDRIAAFNTQRIRLAAKMLWVYPRLLAKLLIAPRPDVYLVSYPCWFDVPVVKLVAVIKRRPLVCDVFISLYDTAISDRKLADRRSFVAVIARFIDRKSIRLSDLVLSDCHAHARFLAGLAGVDSSRFGIVYVGADESVFRPQRVDAAEDLVLFYGSYVPLQGAEWIVRAAAMVQDETDIRFRMIGDGQDRVRVEALASDLGLRNTEFVGFLPLHHLGEEIARAKLVLGIFGTSDKARRVVPHKVFEAVACGRPVLTGESEAVLEEFQPGEIATCKVGDPEALASKIVAMMRDVSETEAVASRGRARFLSDFALAPQSLRLYRELSRVIPETGL